MRIAYAKMLVQIHDFVVMDPDHGIRNPYEAQLELRKKLLNNS